MSKDKTPTPLNTSIILERIISRLDRLEEAVNLNGHHNGDSDFDDWWQSKSRDSYRFQTPGGEFVYRNTAYEIWKAARKDI